MLKKIFLKLGRKNLLNIIIKISALLWLTCIFGFLAIIGYVVGIRKELFDRTPYIFGLSLLGFFLLGCLAFLVGIIAFTAQLLLKKI